MLSQQKSLIFKLKYLVIEPSKPYKLYHFQVVLFKANPFSQISKCKTFYIADDVIKKYGGFWVIWGHYGGSKWQNFTNDPIFIIYFSQSIRWNNQNFFFRTFWKSCLQGFVLKSDVIKKWPKKGPKLFQLTALFFWWF